MDFRVHQTRWASVMTSPSLLLSLWYSITRGTHYFQVVVVDSTFLSVCTGSDSAYGDVLYDEELSGDGSKSVESRLVDRALDAMTQSLPHAVDNVSLMTIQLYDEQTLLHDQLNSYLVP